MNLYDLHKKPDSLIHHAAAQETVPEIFWHKYKNNPAELQKREKYIARSAEYSYYYAKYVLKGRFPAGEAVIATNAYYWGEYERHVLSRALSLSRASSA